VRETTPFAAVSSPSYAAAFALKRDHPTSFVHRVELVLLAALSLANVAFARHIAYRITAKTVARGGLSGLPSGPLTYGVIQMGCVSCLLG